MTTESSARLDIVPIWRRLNDDLISLFDYVPQDKLDWSPTTELWTFRHLFQHLAEAREQWMNRAINDGQPNIGVYENVESPDEIRDTLRQTWQRIERIFTDEAKLDAIYHDLWWREAPPYNGHWVAWHLLEHDIHHRADILLYLTMLGSPRPRVWTA